MLISQISGGMANTLFEYMAGYSLAKKLEMEYVLDISSRVTRSWGFFLDEFDIPPVKKIIYAKEDAENGKAGSYSQVPEVIRNGDFDIYTKFRSDHSAVYQSPNSIKKSNKNIYLCGNFFSRRYYRKNWEEIRKLFSRPRTVYPEIEAFQKEIAGKENVVGIHIRRGDFQTADFTIDMGEDGAYYRAGIAWFREHKSDCVFYVFSDDIEYAKRILGDSEDLRYVHFSGFLDTDFCEFICLSLCRHFILTNESTYGELASQLNQRKDSIKLNKHRGDVFQKLRILKWWLEGCWEMLDRVYLKDKAISYYNARYQKGSRGRESQKRGFSELEALSPEEKIKQIARICLDGYKLTEEETYRLCRMKFFANAELGRTDVTLALAKKLYPLERKDKSFMRLYLKALRTFGAKQEAEIEEKGLLCQNADICFLIVPYCRTRILNEGMVGLGLVLYHMGYKVSFLLEPTGKSDEWLMSHYEKARDWHGVVYPCNWYMFDQINQEKASVSSFLKNLYSDEKSVCKMKVCISRRQETFLDAKGWKHVYYDFSDQRDEEFEAWKRRSTEAEKKAMEEKADYILTSDESKKGKKYIFWKNDFPGEKVIHERWTLGMNGRLPEKEMRIAEAVVEGLTK